MDWLRTNRVDPLARQLADRHYSRQTPGAREFAPPGRNLTLRTLAGDAAWVSWWPKPEWVKHRWGDAWTCTLFRNEGAVLSSALVRQAVAATRDRWGAIPPGGFLTFVDVDQVASRNPGYCFLMAGFRRVGYTDERGLLALQLSPVDFPAAEPAAELQLQLA